MASFFSGLINKLTGGAATPKVLPTRSERAEAYEGYFIHPLPQKVEAQWRLSGMIVKAAEGEDGVEMEGQFIRADLFPSLEEAETFTLRKGRQIIDERGDRLFSGSGETRRF